MSTYRESDWLRDERGRYTGRAASPPASELDERRTEIARTGATPAMSIIRGRSGASSHFWADALRTAPIDLHHPAPKIAMSIGGVRTIQHTYTGDAGTLRMPSVAALERMADTGVVTFDIPVQAGTADRHVSGWCRVHRTGRGAWAVQPMGMDEETAAHVFDRFYRADTARARTTGGTGLGLAIATEDTQIHGGQLEAHGVPGEGASFLLTLPKTAGDPLVNRPLELWEGA